MSAKIKREMELKVLSGAAAPEYSLQLLMHGLRTLNQLKTCNKEVLQAALAARGKRSWYVRHALPYGAKLELCLMPVCGPMPEARDIIRNRAGVAEAITAVKARDGTVRETATSVLARALVARVGNNAEHLIGVVFAIERARRQVLTLAEEGSRWLP